MMNYEEFIKSIMVKAEEDAGGDSGDIKK